VLDDVSDFHLRCGLAAEGHQIVVGGQTARGVNLAFAVALEATVSVGLAPAVSTFTTAAAANFGLDLFEEWIDFHAPKNAERLGVYKKKGTKKTSVIRLTSNHLQKTAF
jgi:hypothetical protein